ncbi:hypothetical protein [Phenylobacterium sp.]|uniref:hypothetical protein n=1 Tax=Phenylobacterium sp. TaxID=1871053 RepID=UPI0025FCBE3B|nr:hypothetical protein [Phenylobacterium sp.]MBX3482541.1 hypothetical protein [Phenylobacterium sp.]
MVQSLPGDQDHPWSWKLVLNDCVLECRRMAANSVDLVVTSIPFGNQYEYSPSINDFGHTRSAAHFFEQMDYLLPELFRVVKPGRNVCIHVKDRVVPGGINGLGFQTVYAFGDDVRAAMKKHGFAYLGRHENTTDVVRENNQTYRLAYSEQLRDGTRMGCGIGEEVLVFRKPTSDPTNGFADEPVVKKRSAYVWVTEDRKGEPAEYDKHLYRAGKIKPVPGGAGDFSRAKWQIVASGYWKVSGDRLLTPEEWMDWSKEKFSAAYHLWKKFDLDHVYDFEQHVLICEKFDYAGFLPAIYQLLQPHSAHANVWTDVAQMRSLNTLAAQAGTEKHLCPLPFDIPILFADRSVVARREGAAHLDVEFCEVESCRRTTWADRYWRTGEIPASAMVEHGWHFECQGCGVRIDDDWLSEQGRTCASVVGTQHSGVFCGPDCKARETRRRALRTAFEQRWLLRLQRVVTARFRDHVKTIVDRNNGAELKIKTFDMKVTTGAKPVFVLLDELHLMSGFSYASRVFGQIQGNMLANPESLFVIITTQSDQPPAGIFRSELQYARGVRDGRITERVRTLPVLYEFPEAVQTSKAKAGQPRKWEDPAIWPMVLPNLGRSLSLDRLIDEFHEAKDKGEEELRRWASQHLNIEIGLGLHADRWRGADHWEQAVHAKVRRLEDLLAACEVAVVGIDGGGLDDLLGVTVIGRIKGSQRWVSWSRAWAEADLLKNRPEIAERLRDFEADKDLVIFELEVRDLTEGDDDVLPPDLAEVADVVLQVEAAGLLPEENAVGLDTAGVAIRLLVEYLKKRKIAEKQMTGVAQGFRLMGAIQCAERKLKERMLVHADQRLMDWCVGNAKAEQKGNNVLITKETAGKAKIDPLAALFNAVELMARNPQPKRKADFSMMFVGGRSAA